MADKIADSEKVIPTAEDKMDPEKPETRRRIPGNLPYTTSPGPLARVLEKIPISEKPPVFNADFLSSVLGVTGGASRPIVPILKACGMLSPSGSPTEIYGQFQTEGGRASAALEALKAGFPEIFKRNTYAHKADEATLRDLIVSITGLPKSDQIVRAIFNTFGVFQKYARSTGDSTSSAVKIDSRSTDSLVGSEDKEREPATHRVGLIYNINIVLPETTNIEVYNVIFRSLKSNLLQ